MNQLTKDQKIEVVERTLRNYKDNYLCYALAITMFNMDLVTGVGWMYFTNPQITLGLLPELLSFMPGNVCYDDPWFGQRQSTGASTKRRKVLEDLLIMLKKRKMNRTIEFRGKTFIGAWVEGFLVILGAGRHYYIFSGRFSPYHNDSSMSNDRLERIEIIRESAIQFTGIYDEVKWEDLTEEERDQWTLDGNMPSEWKGHKVYEGDQVLLQIKGIGTSEREVIFTNGSFALRGDKGDLSLINIDGEQYKIMCVLYNIHDNKLPTVTLST
jgi:hypothetical protein